MRWEVSIRAFAIYNKKTNQLSLITTKTIEADNHIDAIQQALKETPEIDAMDLIKIKITKQ
jgi:hypothetical protein